MKRKQAIGILLAVFAMTATAHETYDLNGDGKTDLADLLELEQALLAPPPPSANGVYSARYMSSFQANNCFDALAADGWDSVSVVDYANSESGVSDLVVTADFNSCKDNEAYVGRCIIDATAAGTGPGALYAYLPDLGLDESALCQFVIGGTWEPGLIFPPY